MREQAVERAHSPSSGGIELALRQLYRVGWRAGQFVPGSVQRMIVNTGALLAVQRGGWHLDQLRTNLSVATGQPVSDDLLRRSVSSYLRNVIEVFGLPGWSASKIISRVVTTGEHHLRRAFRDRGAVVVLPHSGNWDLAGAWASRTGMPVTTVAEELSEPEYSAFRSFREGLGMQVLSHRDPSVLPDLIAAVRAGRLVCLVADRDLLATGLPVSWRGHPVSLPAGPALVARRTGADLLPTVCTFTATGIRLDIGEPVPARPGRDGLAWMTQHVADFFAARIAQTPQDWHLMQPFFPELPDPDHPHRPAATAPGQPGVADPGITISPSAVSTPRAAGDEDVS